MKTGQSIWKEAYKYEKSLMNIERDSWMWKAMYESAKSIMKRDPHKSPMKMKRYL